MSTAAIHRILIVNSNLSSAALLSKRLGAIGLHADYVTTPQEAIAYLNSQPQPPDAILVEIANSNQMASLQLPQMVAENTKWDRYIPIAAYTALSDRETILRAVRSGYADYIVRPTEIETLRDRVVNLVNTIPDGEFATCQKAIHDKATAQVEIDLNLISETGLKGTMSLPLPINNIIELSSPLLEKMGVSPVQTRIVSCEPDGGNRYTVSLSFVGLNPSQVRRIRRHVMYPSSDAAELAS